MSGINHNFEPKKTFQHVSNVDPSDVDLHSLPTSLNKVWVSRGPMPQMDSSSEPSSSSSSSSSINAEDKLHEARVPKTGQEGFLLATLDASGEIKDTSESKVQTVTVTPGDGEEKLEVTLASLKVIGSGSFGTVYKARVVETGEVVAVKKVFQDKRYKNREVQIMKKFNHCNIVKLLYFYYTTRATTKDDMFLHLVLEYIPDTVYRLARQYNKSKDIIPSFLTKLYSYQLFRSLGYIHSLGICHRDIKPQNLLIDSARGILKLCDFGSAKCLVKGENNISYICSRYYRAPELIFGATDYTTAIDVWSGGCVLGEMLMGQPIFPGDSGLGLLMKIVGVLGTPTVDQLFSMNPNHNEDQFPRIKPRPLKEVFPPNTEPEALELLLKLLEYNPQSRIHPLEACAHSFYQSLRQPGATLPSGRPLPPLFNFSSQELASVTPAKSAQLLPTSQSSQ